MRECMCVTNCVCRCKYSPLLLFCYQCVTNPFSFFSVGVCGRFALHPFLCLPNVHCLDIEFSQYTSFLSFFFFFFFLFKFNNSKTVFHFRVVFIISFIINIQNLNAFLKEKQIKYDLKMIYNLNEVILEIRKFDIFCFKKKVNVQLYVRSSPNFCIQFLFKIKIKKYWIVSSTKFNSSFFFP